MPLPSAYSDSTGAALSAISASPVHAHSTCSAKKASTSAAGIAMTPTSWVALRYRRINPASSPSAFNLVRRGNSALLIGPLMTITPLDISTAKVK